MNQKEEKSPMDSVIKHRTEVEKFMENDENSPFHKKGEIPFEGLKYYDIDTTYKIRAQLTMFPFPKPYTMKMSDGSTQPYMKVAWADFYLKGVPQKVVLLKMEKFMDENRFFLPFYDETSTYETYGGGRFLDIEYTGTTNVDIDFNFAYNPYCAYNPNYRCPVPPIENHIAEAIEAGERKYKEGH
ncbi:DUF1684 domain-containing protein [Bacteroidota bacterium]